GRPWPHRLGGALRRVGRLRAHLPGVRHHRRGRRSGGPGQHPERHQLTLPARRGTMTDRLKQLSDAGVSIWLDDLSRERIETGNLADLMTNQHVVGVTSNPSIFQAALSHGERYDAQIRELAALGTDRDQAVRVITTDDVRNACEIMRPAYDASGSV